METSNKPVKHLVIDTNAFINDADIRAIGENIYTIQEVIDEITCKKQLRHLSVLSYDLIIKDVFAENIQLVTEFAKKTGDYTSLSAVDIKVMALVYQLEKEIVGVEHLNTVPKPQTSKILSGNPDGFFINVNKDSTSKDDTESNKSDDENKTDSDYDEEFKKQMQTLSINEENDDVLLPVNEIDQESEESGNDSDGDEGDWITVDNVEEKKKTMDDGFYSNEHCIVSCCTADFAMQNVLKQIGLNVTSYNGKLIRRVRTFILRCVTCFKTTSVMTKTFCPKCGHASLKKVSVTLDENGRQYIFINTRKPLTSKGKRFTLPAPKGGQHAQNPILNPDDLHSRHKPTKLARTKNNPLNVDYIAGYSPFIMRDVNSKSAVLGIRNHGEIKNWMRKNPNEVRRKRK